LPTYFLQLPSIENCEKLELLLITSSSYSSDYCLLWIYMDLLFLKCFWLPPFCLLYYCFNSLALAYSLLLISFLERENYFLEDVLLLLFWLLLAWLLLAWLLPLKLDWKWGS
jgi:hypothetical protein